MDNSNQNAVGLGLPKDDKNLKTVDNPNQAYWELAGGTWTEEQAAGLDWERAGGTKAQDGPESGMPDGAESREEARTEPQEADGAVKNMAREHGHESEATGENVYKAEDSITPDQALDKAYDYASYKKEAITENAAFVKEPKGSNDDIKISDTEELNSGNDSFLKSASERFEAGGFVKTERQVYDLNEYDGTNNFQEDVLIKTGFRPKKNKASQHNSQAKSGVVFIIGGSDGIGEAAAKLFIEKGYKVYNGSRSACPVEGVKNLTLDAENGDSISRAVKEILQNETEIDILVYSAGFSLSAPFEHTLENDYRYLFEVNFFGFAKAVQSVIPSMRAAKNGHIIAIGSMGGLYPIAFDAFYSASKAALSLLVKAMAIELQPFNIKLTTLMPGGVATGFTRKRKVYPREMTEAYEKDVIKAYSNLAALEQNGMTPEKVATAIVAAAESEAPSSTSVVGFWNKIISAFKS